ncbi:MAG: hypothetical protein IPN26_02580 [Bacteroidetes bacterium]|nr:hypothetical protein [Bacteroidota bacterium]
MMKTNQVELLIALAKEIKAEKKIKTKVEATLQSAKILTKHGNFTGKYTNLSRVVTSVK